MCVSPVKGPPEGLFDPLSGPKANIRVSDEAAYIGAIWLVQAVVTGDLAEKCGLKRENTQNNAA